MPRNAKDVSVPAVPVVDVDAIPMDASTDTPPPAATTALVVIAHQRHADALDLVDHFGLPTEATADELMDLGIQAFNTAGQFMVRAGTAFRACKNVLTEDFSSYVEKRGISRQHAYNAMQLVGYLESLPAADARRLLSVSYTKVLAISKADPEVVADLIEQGALDGKQPLSVRELRARLAEAEKRRERAEADAEVHRAIAESAEVRASGSLANRPNATPAWLKSLRVELVAQTEHMAASTDVVESLVGEYVLDADPDGYRSAAAGTAYHLLAAATGRLSRLLGRLQETYPSVTDGDTVFTAALEGDEVERAVARARQVRHAGDMERLQRQHERLAPAVAKRGPGRPRKNSA